MNTGPLPSTVASLTAASFVPHPLHTGDRSWTETNCYVDVWIEVLHTLGLDPIAASAFTLSCDFEGDQWTFFKYPPEDLWTLFGIDVAEMNVWRPVVDHVEEQLSFGRLCTVEGDAWYLPDTRGVSYRSDHVKTTIVPARIDRAARWLGYFHNAGFYELEGDDFDGLFRRGDHDDREALPPYVERIRLDRLRYDDPDLVDRVVALTRDHLGRRPTDNPVSRMSDRLHQDLPWLADQDLEEFHRYSFGLCRQCGASTELAADFVDWLGAHDGGGLGDAATALRDVSDGAKRLQFAMARVVRGRRGDLDGTLDAMADRWEAAMQVLEARYGS
jgi:hypothetical protein